VRFGRLLSPDRLNTIPVPLKLTIARFIHIDPGGATQRRERHHNSANFEIGIANGSAINVLNQRRRILSRAPVRLRQL
jgi:hypothetical protein